jgi:uncharacterized protein (DUF488 family)
VRRPIHTIGHSTRSFEEFAALLTAAGIDWLVDVRRIPRSRRHPQFDGTALAAALEARGIGYEHVLALGGRRGRSEVAPEVNAFWREPGFHAYADYALSAAFRDALAQLRERAQGRHGVVMCSEAVWWRCHRRIISDYLPAAGETVVHILSAHRTEPAHLSAGARPRADGSILYPATEAAAP